MTKINYRLNSNKWNLLKDISFGNLGKREVVNLRNNHKMWNFRKTFERVWTIMYDNVVVYTYMENECLIIYIYIYIILLNELIGFRRTPIRIK